MNKEFVPYEQALELKKLGFDEPCYFAYIRGTRKNLSKPQVFVESIDFNKDFTFVSAPTFSQSFRWFRENHQIFPEVLTDCTTEPKFVFTYNKFFGNPKDLTEQEWGWENNIGQYSELYRTHEEAELACLTKLIEIVEQTKNYEQQETK